MIYSFGDFELNTSLYELRRNGKSCAIQPQTFDLLLYLVENRERVVGRKEIFETIWKGRSASNEALGKCVSAARRAIGDSGELQKSIRTLHRRGFRFVGDVIVREARVEHSGDGLADYDGKHMTLTKREDRAESQFTPPVGANLSLPDKPSIAVLPFDNMSDDLEWDFLADGMTEEILTRLARFSDLFVIARNSSFIYKGRNIDVRDVGKQLGVQYVLEGSIRAAGNRIRISAQLIDTEKGGHVWTDQYDCKIDDIFDVQDEVAARIAATLEPQMLIAEGLRYERAHPDNLGSWGSVIRGLNRLWRFTRMDFEAALEEADRAIALSPNYGLAYAIKTCALGYRSWVEWGDSWYQDAVDAIAAFKQLQAVGSSDSTSLGSAAVGIMFMGRFKQAHETFDTVIQMNPNFAIARGINGYALGCLGHGDEGLAMIDTAIRLSPFDPLHPLFLSGKALCYFVKSEYEESISAAEESIRINPNFLDSYLYKAASHAERSESTQAKTEIQRALRLAPNIVVKKVRKGEQWPDGWAKYTNALARAGLPE